MFKTSLITSEELDTTLTFSCKIFAKKEPMCAALNVAENQLHGVVGAMIQHSFSNNKAFLLKAKIKGTYQTIGFFVATKFDFELPDSVIEEASEDIQSIFTFLDNLSEGSSDSIDTQNTYIIQMIGVSISHLTIKSKFYKKIIGSLATLYFTYSLLRRFKKTDSNSYFIGLVTGKKPLKYAKLLAKKINNLNFKNYFCPIKKTHCFEKLDGDCYYYIGRP